MVPRSQASRRYGTGPSRARFICRGGACLQNWNGNERARGGAIRVCCDYSVSIHTSLSLCVCVHVFVHVSACIL